LLDNTGRARHLRVADLLRRWRNFLRQRPAARDRGGWSSRCA